MDRVLLSLILGLITLPTWAQSTAPDGAQAIADFSKAIELKSASLQAILYYDRGLAYVHKGLNKLAIPDFRAALKIDPAKHEARDQLKLLGAVR